MQMLSLIHILTDVGSTKTSIHETVAALGMESCFVGGHPMAGSEKTGYESSTDHLLENAYYIITPTPHTPASHTDRMVDVAKAIGALPLVLDYHRHDFIVAAISHLPHLIASSLVLSLIHIYAMIAIAHPDFRDELRRYAEENFK